MLFLAEKQEKTRALIALSGGADSTALTGALASLREAASLREDAGIFPMELHALHVNHGVRPPECCLIDETAAADLSQKFSIPFAVTKIPPGVITGHARQYGTGIEGAARVFRYKALKEEALRLGAKIIFTAHTLDDRLETILMAFLKGAGPRGLGALAGGEGFLEEEPLYGLQDNSNISSAAIVRPLLSLSRADVLAYLKERELSWCTDETNNDDRFLRNKIRRFLIPLLDEHFPDWRAPLLRLGDTQAMTADFLSKESKRRLFWTAKGFNSHTEYSISANAFFLEPQILREEALFWAVDQLAGGGEKNGEQAAAENKRPRRKTLRSFAMGSAAAAELGYARLENNNGLVTVKKSQRMPRNAFFSVLIKSAGFYKIDRITVIAKEQNAGSDNADFFACFPLAFYSTGNGKFLAEDQKGRAAIIRNNRLVWKRESLPACGNGSFKVLFNGGPV